MAKDIRFDDGAAYERMMGVWSRLPGEVFLDWLAPAPGLRWLDVGCGNGAFTELLMQRCSPVAIRGLDTSPEQVAYARARPSNGLATYDVGDALALPFADQSFDAATMALVIFFLPDPARGVEEMARVVRPGGTVSAYAWDLVGGGSPIDPIRAEMRALGLAPASAPSNEASHTDAMRTLWEGAGLIDVETRQITVHRTFPDFEDFWTTTLEGSIIGPGIARLAPADRRELQSRMRRRLSADAAGRVAYSSRANAVKGVVPLGAKT